MKKRCCCDYSLHHTISFFRLMRQPFSFIYFSFYFYLIFSYHTDALILRVISGLYILYLRKCKRHKCPLPQTLLFLAGTVPKEITPSWGSISATYSYQLSTFRRLIRGWPFVAVLSAIVPHLRLCYFLLTAWSPVIRMGFLAYYLLQIFYNKNTRKNFIISFYINMW